MLRIAERSGLRVHVAAEARLRHALARLAETPTCAVMDYRHLLCCATPGPVGVPLSVQ